MNKLYLISFFLLFATYFATSQIEDPKIEDTQNNSRAKIIVHIKTGEIYKGFFISQNKDFLDIETEDGIRMAIPTQRIEKIESVTGQNIKNDDKKGDLEQINAVRYMVGTSAFNYKKGVSYLRNNPTTFHRGITDNFSIGVGTSLWALVFRTPIIYVNPHFTMPLGNNVHYKIGLDAIAGVSFEDGDGGAAAVLNTGFTVGQPDLNMTATVYLGGLSGVGTIKPFYSLAGMARISRKLMVVSEGFYIPTKSEGDFGFVFYGGRYITEKASFDMGLLFSKELTQFIPIGIPFFAVTVQL